MTPAQRKRVAARETPGGRERLLEAATALFAERGYAATGIAELCREAGVAKPALYWHFESKEGLLGAVIERVGSQWIERLQKVVYLEGHPLQRIQRLVTEWRTILLEQPELMRLPLIAQLEQGDSDRARAALRKIWSRGDAALIQGIEDTLGVQIQGVDLLAQTILDLLQGAALRQMAEPDPKRLARVFTDLQRTIAVLVADRLPPEVKLEDLP
ncbi:MAG: helix-turn-helix domain-containing protein [Myxococcota bacterium]